MDLGSGQVYDFKLNNLSKIDDVLSVLIINCIIDVFGYKSTKHSLNNKFPSCCNLPMIYSFLFSVCYLLCRQFLICSIPVNIYFPAFSNFLSWSFLHFQKSRLVILFTLPPLPLVLIIFLSSPFLLILQHSPVPFFILFLQLLLLQLRLLLLGFYHLFSDYNVKWLHLIRHKLPPLVNFTSFNLHRQWS